jgi:hypothetical protein
MFFLLFCLDLLQLRVLFFFLFHRVLTWLVVLAVVIVRRQIAIIQVRLQAKCCRKHQVRTFPTTVSTFQAQFLYLLLRSFVRTTKDASLAFDLNPAKGTRRSAALAPGLDAFLTVFMPEIR